MSDARLQGYVDKTLGMRFAARDIFEGRSVAGEWNRRELNAGNAQGWLTTGDVGRSSILPKSPDTLRDRHSLRSQRSTLADCETFPSQPTARRSGARPSAPPSGSQA